MFLRSVATLSKERLYILRIFHMKYAKIHLCGKSSQVTKLIIILFWEQAA